MVPIDMDFPPQHSLMFQTYRHHHQEDQEHHQFIPSNSPNSTSLNPSYTERHFDVAGESFMMKRSDSFSGVDHHNENNNHHYSCHEDHQVVHMGEDNELSDDGLLLGEKKRRLNLEQVKTLEKSFELGNKLDPERKMQLAKALGLQPRQISIWFQNRRARWKTKQLEKDYHVLKKQFDSLRADNDSLRADNKQLLAQLSVVKSRDSSELGRVRNQNKEGDNQASWSNNASDNSSDNINIDLSRTPAVNTSSSSHEISGKNLFPSTSSINQHLQTSTTISDDHLQGLKLDYNQNIVQDHGSNFVCNMFNGIEEQQTFWAWPDQHHFH